MKYVQKLSPLWWTRDLQSLIYFIRELTGVFIAAYVLFEITAGYLRVSQDTFDIMRMIGLAASLVHSLTWFWATSKITPLPQKRIIQVFVFLGLLAAWGAASAFLLTFIYER